jgi:hypothetical protein
MKNPAFLFSALLMIILSACLPLAAVNSRKGSTVEVTMTDGRLVKGELLAVKTDTMIIYDPGTGKGWDLNLQQVTQVRIKRDSKFLLGTIVGLVVGLRLSDYTIKSEDKAGLFYGAQSVLVVPMTGLLCGAIAGMVSKDKKFLLKGQSILAAEENLKRLRRYARERDVEKPAGPPKNEPGRT